MKQLVPLNDRVLIKPIDEGEQMYGSIIVADMGKERPEMGEVIAAGPGRMSEYGKFITTGVSVGDIVMVPKIGSIRMEWEGDEYFVPPFREYLRVVKQTDPNSVA